MAGGPPILGSVNYPDPWHPGSTRTKARRFHRTEVEDSRSHVFVAFSRCGESMLVFSSYHKARKFVGLGGVGNGPVRRKLHQSQAARDSGGAQGRDWSGPGI